MFFYKTCYPLEHYMPINTNTENRMIAKNIEKPKQNNVVTVYPNPAKDYTTFYFTLPGNDKASYLEIVDAIGKPIFSSALNSTNSKIYIWDTKNITNGHYVYKLKTEGNKIYSGRIEVLR